MEITQEWSLAGRPIPHLKAQIAVQNPPYHLGRKLAVNARSESFVDAPEANKLLTRPYRKPFLVPESLS